MNPTRYVLEEYKTVYAQPCMSSTRITYRSNWEAVTLTGKRTTSSCINDGYIPGKSYCYVSLCTHNKGMDCHACRLLPVL